MPVVAVIAEYNPLHTGHRHQLERIRQLHGEDTAILVLLSGNFVQRGDVALLDKYARAKAAVLCGADLVLELPFPYSCAPAEIYAQGAVSILSRLGVVDALSFGSECGNIDSLQKAAKLLNEESFQEKVRLRMQEDRRIGFAALCDAVYQEAFPGDTLLSKPNNILGIQYLCALLHHGSRIQPETILREGNYHTGEGKFPSASSLRKRILENDPSALAEMPAPATDILTDALARKTAPAMLSRLSSILLSKLALFPPEQPDNFFDTGGGIGSRLISEAHAAYSLDAFLEKAQIPHLTNARLRRSLLHLFFQTERQSMKDIPGYTQLLAANKTGQKLLRCIKAHGEIPVLIKPADYTRLPSNAQEQFQRSQRADSLYLWSLPCPQEGNHPLRQTPYCEK